MYQILEVISKIDGVQRREKVLIEWQNGNDPFRILHDMALEYALTPEGQRKCRFNGLSYGEFLNRLTPEMLEPYGMNIRWLDRESSRFEDKTLITRYELDSYLKLMERDKKCVRNTRETAERYVRRLAHMKADGAPLVSTWDDARLAERGTSWACQFIRSEEWNASKFFNEKLAEAVKRAAQSQPSTTETEEQNIPEAE